MNNEEIKIPYNSSLYEVNIKVKFGYDNNIINNLKFYIIAININDAINKFNNYLEEYKLKEFTYIITKIINIANFDCNTIFGDVNNLEIL